MENAVDLHVPLRVKLSCGPDWASLRPYTGGYKELVGPSGDSPTFSDYNNHQANREISTASVGVFTRDSNVICGAGQDNLHCIKRNIFSGSTPSSQYSPTSLI
jgi:hypothetical protein